MSYLTIDPVNSEIDLETMISLLNNFKITSFFIQLQSKIYLKNIPSHWINRRDVLELNRLCLTYMRCTLFVVSFMSYILNYLFLRETAAQASE